MWFVSALLGIAEVVSQRGTISEATAIAALCRSGQVGNVEGLLVTDVAFGKGALSFTNMSVKLYIYFYIDSYLCWQMFISVSEDFPDEGCGSEPDIFLVLHNAV